MDFSSIKREISNLKRNYKNMNNTYEIIYTGELNEDIFQNKIKEIIKQKWDTIEIINEKIYIKKNLILKIDNTGEMKCISKKILKYRFVNDIKINLYNERDNNVNNIEGSDYYDDIYKQNRMVFTQNDYNLILLIKTSNDKETTYEIKIQFKSKKDENKLDNLLMIIH